MPSTINPVKGPWFRESKILARTYYYYLSKPNKLPNYLLNIYVCSYSLVLSSTLAKGVSLCGGQQLRDSTGQGT